MIEIEKIKQAGKAWLNMHPDSLTDFTLEELVIEIERHPFGDRFLAHSAKMMAPIIDQLEGKAND